MRALFMTFLLVSLASADTLNTRAPEFEIQWTSTGILLADTCVDGYRQLPYSSRIERMVVCFQYSGTTDSTLFDVQRVTDDTSRSILTVADRPRIKGGDKRVCVEFEPTDIADLNEDDRLRMDILNVANGNPKNFTISVYVREGARRQ